MATTGKTINILQQCSVAPAAAEHRLPLTFFDMLWLYFHPIKRLLFYQFPCSSALFQETIIPNLKKSLSETLTNYFPVAGKFLYPLDSGTAELRYAPGDSVSLTFAEATEAFDFSYMTGDEAREADDFHYFVPDLPAPEIDSESRFKMIPVLAIQVTLFPGIGLSVGITNHHIIGDASSIVRFIKAWSSVAKIGKFGENHELPIFDRSLIEDPSNRANLFWNQMRQFKIGESPRNFPTHKVRTTFILQKNDIVSLKNLVQARNPNSNSIHLSSFTVTLAHIWSSFAKSAKDSGELVDDNEPEYFGFAVDARRRLDPPLPAAYFGNCLTFAVAESTHGRIKAADGFFVAAELLGDMIRNKVNKKEELLREADDWLTKFGPLMGRRCYGIAGSPKFDLYDTDFGWGNPIKFESVSIDEEKSSISLCKSREFEGGLEIGVSLSKKKMDAFGAVFYGSLKVHI